MRCEITVSMFIMVLICTVTTGSVKANAAPLSERIREIGKDASAEQWQGLMNELLTDRSDVIFALREKLRTETDIEVRIKICCLLGEYRAVEAIEDLAGVIALESKAKSMKEAGKRLPLWGRFPVVDALVKIGRPTIPVMIKLIENSRDLQITERCAEVIVGVEGKKVGAFILKEAIECQTDVAKKDKLRVAIALKSFK